MLGMTITLYLLLGVVSHFIGLIWWQTMIIVFAVLAIEEFLNRIKDE